MDLKSGIVCSLPVLLLIFTAYSEGFPFRKDNDDLVSALARLDRALGEMISRTDENHHELREPLKRNEDGAVPYKRNEDGSIPYKRNEGSSMKRFPDGPVPYKRFYEGDVPYKRDEGHTPYKRGWWMSKPKPSEGEHDDLDDSNPYKRQYDYGDDTDIPYKRRTSVKADVERRDDGHYEHDIGLPYRRASSEKANVERQAETEDDVPYRRTSQKEPRNESLDRVLRYLLDMEERLHERNAEKRDHDDQ